MPGDSVAPCVQPPSRGCSIVASCGPASPPSEALPAAGEWREFQGTWTAVGSRQTIPLGGDRRASIADFNGSLLLTGPSRPAVGFRAEAIVLNDSATGMVGRAVWTDERGDQVYSELRGEGTATGNRLVGTFLGGTGRYAGATGILRILVAIRPRGRGRNACKVNPWASRARCASTRRRAPGAGGSRP